MSRKTKTEITIHIRIQVPEKSNTAEVMEYVRDAIASSDKLSAQDGPIIKLVKKETTYA